ncbi:FG-GAP-like repeat-containing protein [Winogradskyella alexanderae]|uniref:FG-GAP-like repeat-containing protein n=1 Tax=Winogradskyella alexanderae TaxID=2877123 RepID=A0ABS7XSS4_9FLAO|nr:FG-GAP-like repeat-containing protein [Winogradskyella alexanderae]MCA0133081.1 FG-GAP-like repeat-containing protein [Winogradskyella alexanderae]
MKLFQYIFWLFSLNLCAAQVIFNNEAEELGIEVVCGNTLFGNGVSFFDYDNDGWDDITVATADGDPIRFFKNINGNFVEQTLNIPDNNWRNKQINWVDIDNDGDNDLFVTSDTEVNRLFENTGNMIFQDITASSGMLNEVLVTYGASWGDYNNDGYLDVFLSNRDTTIPNVLYKNNGNNTFTLANTEAGLLSTGTLSFCAAFIDYNKDGYQDIYVANDKVANANTMYKNNGDSTFTEVGFETGTDITIDAMSVTVEDYNSDGWPDIYVTNDVVGNVLLQNNGNGTFSDVAQSTNTTMNSVAWGAVFLDVENDGDLDLYVSAEHDGTVSGYLSSALFNNTGNFFSIVNSAIPDDFAISYSNAIGDTDNDGLPEILVNNINNNNIFLWKNNSTAVNKWLKVKLEGTLSNRNGVGSLIEISVNGNKQFRYTCIGEGYLGQNSATEFFGIGNTTEIDYVKVTWLSGTEDIIYNVVPNQNLKIVEGSSLSLTEFDDDLFKIFPNPVSDYLIINSELLPSEIQIFNPLGEVILKLKPNINHESIDVSELTKGLYILKLVSEDSTQILRFIKK